MYRPRLDEDVEDALRNEMQRTGVKLVTLVNRHLRRSLQAQWRVSPPDALSRGTYAVVPSNLHTSDFWAALGTPEDEPGTWPEGHIYGPIDRPPGVTAEEWPEPGDTDD